MSRPIFLLTYLSQPSPSHGRIGPRRQVGSSLLPLTVVDKSLQREHCAVLYLYEQGCSRRSSDSECAGRAQRDILHFTIDVDRSRLLTRQTGSAVSQRKFQWKP
jgi:hypothetical protein